MASCLRFGSSTYRSFDVVSKLIFQKVTYNGVRTGSTKAVANSRSPLPDVNVPGRPQRNAISSTDFTHIPNLLDVAAAKVKPGGWEPTVVHTAGEVTFTVIRVVPGGEVPAHFHHQVWDYFVPLQGAGIIEVTTESGQIENYPMNMHSFLAMPPMAIHRVRNKSSEVPFAFLIAQTPWAKYDFIAR